MDEQAEEKQGEAEQDKPTSDADGGIQSETESLIEQSNKAAERTEKATEALKAQLDRQEKLVIKQQLAGKGQAGMTAPTPVDKEAMAANERIMSIGRATGAKWAQPQEQEI